MVPAVALYGMVCPLILMECSVTEDSSFGGGGVGSAGFSFLAGFVFLSWGCSWAAAANGARLSSSVALRAVMRFRLGMVRAPEADLGTARIPVYTSRGRQGKEARIGDGLPLRHREHRADGEMTKDLYARYPPPPVFSQVLILKEVKVVCFDTLLQVLILKEMQERRGNGETREHNRREMITHPSRTRVNPSRTRVTRRRGREGV